jgi:hypothetical protein
MSRTNLRAVILVEGASDRRAVETLARRRGRDLAAEGIEVVPMGGVTNIRAHLERYGPLGLDVAVAGLCDAGEVHWFTRGLERAGFGVDIDRREMERLGFFVCDADLEDELIGALGTDAVERMVESQGELRALRTLQKQPAQQGRPLAAQLRRFMGSRGGRKIQYAPALVEALDLDRVPRPLDAVLDAMLDGATGP